MRTFSLCWSAYRAGIDVLFFRIPNLFHRFFLRLPGVAFSLLVRLICFCKLQEYRCRWIFQKRPKTTVQSVLHLSIISSKQYMLSRLLRAHGIRSEYFALNADLVDKLSLGYDYHIPYHIEPLERRLLELYYLWYVLSQYDVIHFHFNTLLSLDDGWELKYLRKMKKVLVFHFRGCDLRQKSINLAKNPDLNCCQACDYPQGSCDTEYQRKRLDKAKKYGDLFFVTTPDLLDFFPEAEHLPFISPYGIEIDSIVPSFRENGVFRIVTSSNHPGVDGIPYLRDAVMKLRSEGERVELVEVTNKSLREALSIYRSADLYAGKLCMGYYNNANIETLLMGIPNMSYIRENYLPNIPDCPIIIARPENIYEKLKEWLSKPKELKKVGALGPAFIKKYHNPDQIAAKLLSEYKRVWAQKQTRRGSASSSHR